MDENKPQPAPEKTNPVDVKVRAAAALRKLVDSHPDKNERRAVRALIDELDPPMSKRP